MTNGAIAAPTDERPTSFRAILAVLLGAEFASALPAGMIYTALSKLYGIYGDPAHVTWLVTAYALSAAASTVLFSRLGDIYGRAKLLKLMLLFATVGSVVSAVATDLDVIIFGRALQGVSTAILPLGLGILREHTTDLRQRNFGVGLGYVLSGLIVDNLPWQFIFVVSGGAALLTLLIALRIVRDPPLLTVPSRLDWTGAVFVVPVTALLLGLTLGWNSGWRSPVALGLLVVGLLSLAWWVRHELRQENPLVDVRLLANPTIAIVNAAIFFTAMAPMIYTQVLLPLLQQPAWTGIGLGVSATMAGLIKLPTNATSASAAILVGWLSRDRSMRPAVIGATQLNLLAFVLLIFYHDSAWFIMAVSVILIAPGVTIMFACAPGLIMNAAPPDRTSEATGLTSVLRSIATAIGTQVLALSLASSAVTNAKGQSFPDERAYVVTFGVITVACLLSLLCAMLIPRETNPRDAA
ncbi:MAG TPA: MFS transporter [Novosphingobium sp.]